jgi:LacI family transcriptional regulator
VIRKTGSTIPVVELARYSESRLFDSVISDDREGALQLTRYLIGLGHRRIAIIAGNPPFSTTRARVQGFREAFQEANLPLDESLICCREYSPAWGAESLLALLRLHEPPTAVFAASNQLVLGAIRAARVAGLTIPRDLSLAGYDDPEWFPLWNAGITTYALPLQEMGLLAAQLLLARMSGHEGEATTAMPMLTRLSGHLIVRGSCAPLRSNKKGGTLSQAPSASSP